MPRTRKHASNAERQRAYRARKRNAERRNVTLPAPYYADGAVELYCGDALELLPLVSERATLTVTDPPYNVGLDYSSGDNRADYAAWCRRWWALCPQPLVFTPGTVNLGMWYQIAPPMWVAVWHKPNQCSWSRLGGANVWEPVLFYGKPAKSIPQDLWTDSISTRQADVGDHPCPKDLAAWRKLLGRLASPGDVILDPFAGTGTTLRAAKDLGLRAIGIELEARYCAIAARRLSQHVLAFAEAAS